MSNKANLDRKFKSAIKSEKGIAVKALNYAARVTRTKIDKDFRGEIALPANYTKNLLTWSRARSNKLQANIRARFRPVSLARFGAKQLKKKRGVSFKVLRRKGRVRKRGFFMFTGNNGNRVVAYRTSNNRVKAAYSVSIDQFTSVRINEYADIAKGNFTKEQQRLRSVARGG